MSGNYFLTSDFLTFGTPASGMGSNSDDVRLHSNTLRQGMNICYQIALGVVCIGV